MAIFGNFRLKSEEKLTNFYVLIGARATTPTKRTEFNSAKPPLAKKKKGDHRNIRLCRPEDLKKHRCPLCKDLLRSPVQTERGEVACKECYEQYDRGDGLCPVDGQPWELEGKVYRDKAKEKEILTLDCRCANDGCEWKGKN